ncbi:MAG: MSEP-CTERM sorting domain-containing protein, partial [Bacteroidota bacterium]
RTWIDLEITNESKSGVAEYMTNFALPEGAWISDYYLWVGDRKEMGILSEKRTAMWVFANIRNENRDPGILYYLGGNKVAFRVFPFRREEVRKTGIEILHKEPVSFAFDDQEVVLGDTTQIKTTITETEEAIFIPASAKSNLKPVSRTPYFHFLIDASGPNTANRSVKRIEALTKKYPDFATNGKVTFVGTYLSQTYDLASDWQSKRDKYNPTGGFFADRAIKTILREAYLKNEHSYPIPVLLTDDFTKASFSKNYTDWQFAVPELQGVYTSMRVGLLKEISFETNPYTSSGEEVENLTTVAVRAYEAKDGQTYFVPDNGKSSFIVKRDIPAFTASKIEEKSWKTAAAMQAEWQNQLLNPKGNDEAWAELVKSSFESRIMMPVTSYLVVENEAQKAILKRKQAQVLKSKKSLDLGEDTQQMSEPSLWVLLLGVFGIIAYRKRKR